MGQSTISLHKDSVTSAEVTRQNAMAVATTQATARQADIVFHQSVVTSAMANSVSPVASLTALRELGGAAPALPVVTPHVWLLPLLPSLVDPKPPDRPIGKPPEGGKPPDPPPVKPEPVVAQPVGWADEEAEDEEDDARASAAKPKGKHPTHRR